ncbi:secretory lipase [Macrophomina phaseolina]|uniref:Secretory lipase n=1 Tax=Macrophomina phaseolina TaxID=35725 RepID=A0ABQ8FXL4_9PEZI|nr:secretory lipase [Macrophomina phaseolina]
MVFVLSTASSQETALPGPQCQDFASSYKLSAEQISRANISQATAYNVEIALNFERSNWATNSVTVDPFYRVDTTWSSSALPGTLFTIENVTNTSLYTLPASVSLSRITYQTLALNGTTTPTSAYILWPYIPRSFTNISGHPIIGWAHGTSGIFPECAPSHIRNLWYQYSAPFTMALQGYVVVAPDYAGLGIGRTSRNHGTLIKHPYLLSFSQAHDLLYAVKAAQAAFPSLSQSFVTVGHSQGGGAVWAAATLSANMSHLSGYLGTVAASPTPAGTAYLEILSKVAPGGLPVSLYLAYGIQAAYEGVDGREIFTSEGLQRLALFQELRGCSSVATLLFEMHKTPWVTPNISAHWAARAFAAAGDYSAKAIGVPMLVLQGLSDETVLPAWTQESVERTCAAFPGSALDLVAFEGVTHVPVMYAGQRIWLDWVADRFNGVPVEGGCRTSTIKGMREKGDYLAEFNYFLEPVTEAYQVA